MKVLCIYTSLDALFTRVLFSVMFVSLIFSTGEVLTALSQLAPQHMHMSTEECWIIFPFNLLLVQFFFFLLFA